MAELEQFCILAKSQKGRALSALVQQVLSHKKIFVFGELLVLPSVQALNSEEEFAKTFNTLELFAYGTYRDFIGSKQSYLDLTDAQLTKLRQLSLISLAAREKVISYAALQKELDIASTNLRTLEDLVIDTIYANLMNGKIDQKNQIVRVRSVVSRDVRPEQLALLIEKLRTWRDTCGTLLDTVHTSSAEMKARKAASAEEQRELQFLASAKRASLKDSLEAGVEARDLEDAHVGSRGRHALMNNIGGMQARSSSAGGNKSFKRSMPGSQSNGNRGPPGGGRGGGGGGFLGSLGGLGGFRVI